jgi:hypothetical protein
VGEIGIKWKQMMGSNEFRLFISGHKLNVTK